VHTRFILGLLLTASAPAQQVINTFAGTDYFFTSDGQAAVNSALAQPIALAADASGNLYVADQSFAQLIKIDSNGVATVVAGTGIHISSGDSGPARAASLSTIRGVALDAPGNIYVSDGNRIRKIAKDGTISTYAGGGSGGDGSPALLASLGGPAALAFDGAGNLYIVMGTQTIRKVDTKGIITTVAGTGQLGALGDGGPAVNATIAPSSIGSILIDENGNLLIADTSLCRIRKVDAASAIITTIAGNGTCGTAGDGGPATSARINQPAGLALDGLGGYYISESLGQIVRRVDSTGIIRTVAGTAVTGFQGDGGSALRAQFATPYALAADPSGNIFVADRDNERVRKFTLGGSIATILGTGAAIGDGGSAADAKFVALGDIKSDTAGNLYLTDARRIRKISPGGIISTIAGTGRNGIGSPNGTLATSADLQNPTAVAVDPQGRVVFSDFLNARIYRIQADGTLQTIAGAGSTGNTGNGGQATAAAILPVSPMRYDRQGNLYFQNFAAQGVNGQIRVIKSDGTINLFAGGGSQRGEGVLATLAYFTSIIGLAPDNAGNVYIQEGGTPRIRKVDSKGIITTIAGTGTVGASPDGTNAANAQFHGGFAGLTLGPGGGLVFDDGNKVRGIGADGTLMTFAGSGNSGFSGDGGLASAASFAGPNALAFDPQGNLLITDPNNQRIREVFATPVPLITLSQKGLTFLAAGNTPQPQTFIVVNGALGTLNFSISTSTQSGGNWLSTSIAEGVANANAPGVPVIVSVDPSKLANGDYYGTITIVAPGVPNSPQLITVVLRVTPASTIPLDISVLPAGFIFTGTAGGSAPAAQTLTLSTLATQVLNYGATLTYGGLPFLSLPQATTGTLTAGKPVTLQLQPVIAGLAPGVYDATLTIAAGSAPVKKAKIYLILAPHGSIPAKNGRSAGGSCTPARLLPVASSLVDGFSAPFAYPLTIVVLLADDCGNPIATGSVKASFSNGDPPLSLASLQDGSWSATWQPGSSLAQATVSIDAQTGPPQITGSAQISGALQTNTNPPPLIGMGGVLNSATYGLKSPLAPGSLISVFGNFLSDSVAQASAVPLPSTLNGTTVLIAGRPAPLVFVSKTQVNAIVPYDLAINATHQVLVTRGNTISLPEPISVQADAGGVFTSNSTGTGAGIVVAVHGDGSYNLVNAMAPASVGDVLVIYATGLGDVSPRVIAGAIPPSSPPAQVADPVTATIGGVPAVPDFAGLTPGFPGLYQINVTVPGGVTPGDSVPLVLIQGGLSSQAVTIAVR
jgi:uncharacterized protein (TIGR03437 family)